MTSVGVVVPAFRPDVGRLRSFVGGLDERLDAELRVELDDPAPGVADRLADLPATVSVADRRRGKGAAITAGFEALDGEADAEVLAFADADGSTPPASIADVVAAVREGGADLAVGSRRHPEADVQSHQTLARRRLGDAFAAVARQLVEPRLYDYQCGAKAVARPAWRTLRGHLHEAGFAWDVELVAMAGAFDLSVTEVPVTWIDRPDSTVSPLSTPPALALALLRAHHRARRVAGSRLHDAIGADGPALVERLPEANADRE